VSSPPSGRAWQGGAPRIARRALVLGAILSLGGFVLSGRPFVPLYDGIISADAYRWLDPPPGQHPDPQGVTATLPVSGGQSPLVAVNTPENVPQAQVFAIPGGLVLPAGTTRLDVSIAAVQPPAVQPTDGEVVTGNVYAIAVTTQSGATVTADPSSQVSVVLRAPDPNQAEATVARFDGTAWHAFGTVPAGVGSTFEAVVTQFGEFALLAQPPAPTAAVPGAAQSAAASGSPVAGSAGESGLESPAASPSELAPTATPETVAPSPVPGGGGSGIDRGILTLALGGLAVIIVILVGVAAFAPRRRRPAADRPPPSRRRNRSGWS